MHSDDRPTELPPSLPALCPDGPPAVTVRVVAFVLLIYAVWPPVVASLLMAAGLAPRPSAAPTPEEVQALTRAELLSGVLAFPLQIVSFLWLLGPVGAVRAGQIGLTLRQFGWNCLKGVDGWVNLAPLCLIMQSAVTALYGSEAASNVQEHPFVRMSQQGLTPQEWFLLIFTATVAAPVMEEVLFRGALQSWLEERSWAPHVAMGLAFLTAVLMKTSDVVTALPQGGAVVLLHLTPILFVAGLGVVYLAVWMFRRGPAAPAVFAASALFAAVHSFAWPSPVALFVLALGLGWLAHRTRSLAGPIVLHSLFNAVSCMLLFFPQSGVTP